MGSSRWGGGGTGGLDPTGKTQVALENLVRIPFKKQLDPLDPIVSQKRSVHTALFKIC